MAFQGRFLKSILLKRSNPDGFSRVTAMFTRVTAMFTRVTAMFTRVTAYLSRLTSLLTRRWTKSLPNLKNSGI